MSDVYELNTSWIDALKKKEVKEVKEVSVTINRLIVFETIRVREPDA